MIWLAHIPGVVSLSLVGKRTWTCKLDIGSLMWSQTWIPVGPGLQPVHSLTAFKLCSHMNLHSTFCCRAVMILAVLQELIEKLNKGELPKNEYPCMNDPSPTMHGTTQGLSSRTSQVEPAHSMRSRRTATWARPRNSDDGYSRYVVPNWYIIWKYSCFLWKIISVTFFICHWLYFIKS